MHKESEAWRVVDEIAWENAAPNASLGRATDGAEEWVWFHTNAGSPPTPNASNGEASEVAHDSQPRQWQPKSPCNLPCEIALPEEAIHWSLYNLNGGLTMQETQQRLLITDVPTGLHVLQWTDRQEISHRHKIVLN